MTYDTLTSSTARYTAYDPWAWLYNQSLGPQYCREKLPFLEKLLLPELEPAARILDLCCGTGHLTQQLEAKGYQMVGLDGSEQMLHYARQNAPQAELITADARDFELPAPVDAVFSASASLNHVLSLAQLSQVFANVYAALQADGVFLFDLRLRGNYGNYPLTGGEVKEDYAWAVGEGYDADSAMAFFKITIFHQADQVWQRSDLTYQAKAYACTDVQTALEQAGFRAVQIYDRAGDLTPPADQQMVYFLAHK